MNFEDVMNKRKSIHKAFVTHLDTSQNMNNYLFVEKIKEYKTSPRKYELAKDILDNFIDENSEFEINISNKQKKTIIKAFGECRKSRCPSGLFKDIGNVIKVSMKHECFSQFMNSQSLIDYINNKLFNVKQTTLQYKFFLEILKTDYKRLVLERMLNKRTGIPLSTKTYMFVKYYNCFSGAEYFKWFAIKTAINNIHHVKVIGQHMQDMGWIKPSVNGKYISNNDLLFHFVVTIKNGKIVPEKTKVPSLIFFNPRSKYHLGKLWKRVSPKRTMKNRDSKRNTFSFNIKIKNSDAPNVSSNTKERIEKHRSRKGSVSNREYEPKYKDN